MRAATLPFALGFILLLATYNLTQIGRNVWLSAWSDENQRVMEGAKPETTLAVRLGFFAFFGLMECEFFMNCQGFSCFLPRLLDHVGAGIAGRLEESALTSAVDHHSLALVVLRHGAPRKGTEQIL